MRLVFKKIVFFMKRKYYYMAAYWKRVQKWCSLNTVCNIQKTLVIHRAKYCFKNDPHFFYWLDNYIQLLKKTKKRSVLSVFKYNYSFHWHETWSSSYKYFCLQVSVFSPSCRTAMKFQIKCYKDTEFFSNVNVKFFTCTQRFKNIKYISRQVISGIFFQVFRKTKY